MRSGIKFRHIVKKAGNNRFTRQIPVSGADFFQIRFTALLHDLQPFLQFGFQQPHRLRHHAAENRSTLAAAQHQNLKFVIFIKLRIRQTSDLYNRLADRHSRQYRLDMLRRKPHVFKTLRNQIRIFAQKTVGSAHHRVLLMNNQVCSGQNRRHRTGKGSIAAKTDHTDRTPFQQNKQSLQRPPADLAQTLDFKPRRLSHHSAGIYGIILNFAKLAFIIVLAALVCHQSQIVAPFGQLLRQSLRRIDMTAGSAGRQNNQGFLLILRTLHLCPPHARFCG